MRCWDRENSSGFCSWSVWDFGKWKNLEFNYFYYEKTKSL
jgi:hypothetical protein